jgi:hypothetical protein
VHGCKVRVSHKSGCRKNERLPLLWLRCQSRFCSGNLSLFILSKANPVEVAATAAAQGYAKLQALTQRIEAAAQLSGHHALQQGLFCGDAAFDLFLLVAAEGSNSGKILCFHNKSLFSDVTGVDK